MVIYSGEIGLFLMPNLVQAQLVMLPSAQTCTGVCIALGYYLQNHNITDVVIMDLIIVSDVELFLGNPFDIGGVLKQHLC
jgi:hypothetical protein